MSFIPPNEPMPHAPPPQANGDEDVIDLAQITAFVRRNWGTLVAGIAVAMLCGAALFALLPSRWQAQATLEIGQVPAGTPVSGSRAVALIEPPPQAAERLKQRELVNSALASLGIPTDQPEEPHAALFRRTVKAAIIKNTNFIQITGAGYSPEEARKNVAAAAQVLLTTHSKLMIPMVGRLMTQLDENTKRMAETQAERSRLKAILDGAEKANSKIDFAPNIVAVNQLANKDNEIQRIIAERSELQDTLSPSRTYPTRIIDAVYVEPRPSFPKLPLFLAVGALLGLVAGIALAWYRDRNRVV